MKRFLNSSTIFSILILITGACAPAPTASSVPSETPSPTPTNTLTEAPTSIPTETPAPAESDLNPAYTETISGELLSVQIITNFITDESLGPIITAIKVNPNYNNSEGKNSQEAITEFTARTFYKVWLKKGGVDGTGPKTEVSFEDYMGMWAEAQTSGREEDWRAVQITIKANDTATEGYEPVPTTIWFGYSGEAPEGVRAINEFDIALVKASKMKNIKITNPDLGVGYSTNIENKKLIIYRGLNTSSPNIRADKFLIESLSVITQWIISNTNPTSLDNGLIKILSNNGSSIDNFESVLEISPQ